MDEIATQQAAGKPIEVWWQDEACTIHAVALPDANTPVTVISSVTKNSDTIQLVGTANTGNGPISVALSSDGKYVYVVPYDNGSP